MSEQDSISERCAGSAESAIPEHEVGAIAEGRVSQANSFEEIASLAESIKAMNRPLISQQLAESIKAMNRPLISQQLAESIKAMNWPLISQQLAESIKAMNWPLISQQLAESIKAMNRPLISQQLAESIKAMNRPLISQQLAESIKAMNWPLISQRLAESIKAMNRPLISQQLAESLTASNLRAATLPALWFKKSLDVHVLTALDFARQSVRSPEKPRIQASSGVVEVGDTALSRERLHWLAQFDAFVKDDGLRRVCRKLFADGYYTLAVQRACTYIDNMVRQKSGRDDKDGADLMRAVFSPKTPILQLNKFQSRSDINEQLGYMEIFAGMMTGIRNPRVHEHDLEDTPVEALERLVLANHLMRMLNKATLI